MTHYKGTSLMKHGFYSKKQALQYGVAYAYTCPGGVDRVITQVSDTNVMDDSMKAWDDMTYVGEVAKWSYNLPMCELEITGTPPSPTPPEVVEECTEPPHHFVSVDPNERVYECKHCHARVDQGIFRWYSRGVCDTVLSLCRRLKMDPGPILDDIPKPHDKK